MHFAIFAQKVKLRRRIRCQRLAIRFFTVEHAERVAFVALMAIFAHILNIRRVVFSKRLMIISTTCGATDTVNLKVYFFETQLCKKRI